LAVRVEKLMSNRIEVSDQLLQTVNKCVHNFSYCGKLFIKSS
jgi:hypothetical protein